MKTYRTVAERDAAVERARKAERRAWERFAAVPDTEHQEIARAYVVWGRANLAYRAIRNEEWRVPNETPAVPA